MRKIIQEDDFTIGSLIKVSIRALGIAYFITVPSFVIFSLILAYMDFPDKYLLSVVMIVTIFSVFCSGFFTAVRMKKKGWLSGTFAGCWYILVLYLLSSIVYGDFTITRYTFIMTIIGILSGAIGGIIGLNTLSKRRRVPKMPKKIVIPKRR